MVGVSLGKGGVVVKPQAERSLFQSLKKRRGGGMEARGDISSGPDEKCSVSRVRRHRGYKRAGAKQRLLPPAGVTRPHVVRNPKDCEI